MAKPAALRGCFYTNPLIGKGENKGTRDVGLSFSPFPPAHCLQQQQQQLQVSRRLRRLRSPSLLSAAQDTTVGPVSFSLDVSIQ
ncbi:hypothetical protein Q5P01_020979 [Channa striata]|uniref:Uncharacterized protein n=1 Tax=Channa striata TaxID=64152 RepID=A0AA88S9M3_CHASR|nr:hypothetical protein Q5P01_020979 [Channa striata]